MEGAEAGGEVKVCKHWQRMGWCLYTDRCRFRHPPIAAPTDSEEKEMTTQTTTSLAEDRRNAFAKLSNERFRNRGPGRRNRIRNRSKAGAFRRWLLDTFGRDVLAVGTGVLDVAGGKGELSFELANLSGLPTTVVDPRTLQLDRFNRRLPLGIYHRNGPWQAYNHLPAPASVAEVRKPGHLRSFFDEELLQLLSLDQRGEEEAAAKGFREKIEAARLVAWTEKGLVAGTYGPGDAKKKKKEEEEQRKKEEEEAEKQSEEEDEHEGDVDVDGGEAGGANHEQDEPPMEWASVRQLLLGCSLIVGLHPDQATDAIVDFAVKWNKGFAIVPCCVYQKQFQRRRHNGAPVSTYDQFVAYLIAKAPDRIKTATLDFEGKNLVLYSPPPLPSGSVAVATAADTST